MKVYITCSNCGNKRSWVWNRFEYPNAKNAIREGWGSYSVNLYCPACSASWIERNGDDKPMNSKLQTLDIVWSELASQISYNIPEEEEDDENA